MLSLTKIFLYNWHRFENHLLPVTGDLYLTGENTTGKSTILDALQLVLIGDLKQIHFNQAAQSDRTRSTRKVETYVLAKTDEEFLRRGSTIAYVILEFTDTVHHEQRTVGVCMEVSPDRPHDRTHFILSEGLDPDLYIVNGKPRSRRELRLFLKERKFAAVYEHGEIEHYQEDLLNRLGGLNRLFFDLLGRALTFKPIYDVHDFVSQMILPPEPIDLKSMQEAQYHLITMERLAEQVKEKIEALREIVNTQNDLRERKHQFAENDVLLALLRVKETNQSIANLDHLIDLCKAELHNLDNSLSQVSTAKTEAEHNRDTAYERLMQHDSKVQRDRLREAIEKDSEQLTAIQTRWNLLQQILQTIANDLDTILTTHVHFLENTEQSDITALSEQTARLSPDTSTTRELADTIVHILPLLDIARTRIQDDQFELKNQIRAARAERGDIEQAKKHLEKENKVQYPPPVDRLCNYMEQRLGYRPQLLCEVLEVPEERWQEAVEAQLGRRRFAMIVPSAQFDQALNILDDARATQQIYGYGLLDLQRLQGRRQPPWPDSLAMKVQVLDQQIQPYIDMVLGSIITCESVSQLRTHQRAITPEVMVYNEAMAYAMDPRTYRPLCIGSRAKQSQLAETSRQLEEGTGRLALLVPQMVEIEECLTRLKALNNNLNKIQPTLQEPLDTQPLSLRILEYQQQLEALDLKSVEELESEIESWKEKYNELQKQEGKLDGRKNKLENDKQDYENKKAQEQSTLVVRLQEVERLYAAYLDFIEEAERISTETDVSDIEQTIKEVEEKKRNIEQDINLERIHLASLATGYNTLYTFRAQVEIAEDEEAYPLELQRLEETELPQQQELIIQVRRKTEDQLRQDLLHRLAERIHNATRMFDRINAILGKTRFHERSYQLKCPPDDGLRHYYDVIIASSTLGEGSLFESAFYQDHKDACDRLFEILLNSPRTQEEQKRQSRLVDYRNYLSYDILITRPDGRTASLKRTLEERSGGETQTPFYVAIAAAFASLYKFGEQSHHPSIRLAIFDEAFSKMDQRYIDSTLEVFRLFNLQIVVATPPDRSPYLGPRMHTSFALVLQDNTVRIEPLRRYLDESSEPE